MLETSKERDPIAQFSPEELLLLAEPHSPLHRILDILPFIIRIRNQHGRVLFRNKAAVHFDSSSDNLKHLLEMADWGGSLSSAEPQSWIQPWLSKDRAILHYSCRRIPIHDAKQQIIGNIEYALDISTEQNVRLSYLSIERRFDILVEKSIAGVYIIQNRKFIYCNKKLAEIHGYTQEEIRRLSTFESLVAEPDRSRVSQTISSQLQHLTQHIQYRFLGCKKDGSLLHLETVGGIIQYNGQPAILGTVLDITSQTKIEEKLQFTQKMEVAGQIASTIAHDFNNLLTVIKGSATVMSMDLQDSSPAQKNLSQIQEAADRSIKLTQQLLQLGKQRVSTKDLIPLDDVLGHWIQTFSKLLPQTVQYTPPPHPIKINGDEAAIERTIFSLITYISSQLPPSGSMNIKLESLLLDATSPMIQLGMASYSSYAVITLSYEGTGLSEEAIHTFFDPAFAPKKNGIPNLALSIAYNLIRKHKGWIQLSSRLGEQTTFTIHLPIAYEDTESSISPSSPTTSTEKSTSPLNAKQRDILVVEDEEIIRSILEIFLSRLGYNVLQASNADEGLEKWHTNQDKIALILSDIVMPGSMNGSDMVKQCLAERPSIKAIFMSGYDPTNDLPQGPNLSFIAKPFSMDQIAEAVGKMMS